MYENIWIKVEVNMFNGPKSKIIDTYDKNDTIHYVWFRCMTLAGAVNDNGYLYINKDMPYTIKTLAIEFNRSIDDVKYAIKVLKKLQMIEYTEDKFFRVKNWTKHQNIDALEKIRIDRNNRVAKHRAKIKSEKFKEMNQDNNMGNSDGDEFENINNNVNETKVEDTTSENEVTNEEISNTTRKNRDEDYSDIHSNKNDSCNTKGLKINVTCNNEVTCSNVTVTDKIKNKKKTKKEDKDIESEEDEALNSSITLIKQNSEGKMDGVSKNKDQILEKYEIKDFALNLSNGCERLAKYHESVTGRIGGLEHGKLRGAIAMHGESNVKMAIDAAIKVGKAEMDYINGILSNWRREGYPEDNMEVRKNGFRSAGKSNKADKNEFTGFKPKEPRKLTEIQRKKAESNLI
ncbi:phage replisome organizer N-terminal domain-containing protein [Clostridium beijerinckii]|uniref:Phage replisome organizer n=1 Tax=Clostridium beijerinckii TaxID=1520 RepID=A0AAE5H573_CLOBE|nr:phage replisome organizer N-terminal domain-containing protein [Clostridium beijerinckii]NRT35551.1 putative phage replisome organizer [Clostridium beijerinckii]NRT45021.1 putative phage replisome organizer [Clostridium beijerinckii]NRZ20983.1 putative phage replisome organizer [Clostridium beijerinckii]NSB14408.1 putative phage replisome organizer [Clostridium beijerinckii]OOM33131.1 hypothetical protein CLOBE_07840 [Clostridium beijerinckii]